MKMIWKYEVPDGQPTIIQMPKDAQILSIQPQGEKSMIWALVDIEQPKVKRAIYCSLTGSNVYVRSTKFEFIGTCQFDDGEFVAHYFDCGELP